MDDEAELKVRMCFPSVVFVCLVLSFFWGVFFQPTCANIASQHKFYDCNFPLKFAIFFFTRFEPCCLNNNAANLCYFFGLMNFIPVTINDRQ